MWWNNCSQCHLLSLLCLRAGWADSGPFWKQTHGMFHWMWWFQSENFIGHDEFRTIHTLSLFAPASWNYTKRLVLNHPCSPELFITNSFRRSRGKSAGHGTGTGWTRGPKDIEKTGRLIVGAWWTMAFKYHHHQDDLQMLVHFERYVISCKCHNHAVTIYHSHHPLCFVYYVLSFLTHTSSLTIIRWLCYPSSTMLWPMIYHLPSPNTSPHNNYQDDDDDDEIIIKLYTMMIVMILIDWLIGWLTDWLTDWLIDGWMDGWMDGWWSCGWWRRWQWRKKP